MLNFPPRSDRIRKVEEQCTQVCTYLEVFGKLHPLLTVTVEIKAQGEEVWPIKKQIREVSAPAIYDSRTSQKVFIFSFHPLVRKIAFYTVL